MQFVIKMESVWVYVIPFYFSSALATQLFSYGTNSGDTVLIDMTANISVVDLDDGIKLINTVNFPFFDLKDNKKIQVNNIFSKREHVSTNFTCQFYFCNAFVMSYVGVKCLNRH